MKKRLTLIELFRNKPLLFQVVPETRSQNIPDESFDEIVLRLESEGKFVEIESDEYHTLADCEGWLFMCQHTLY